LKGFERVALKPGESKELTFNVGGRRLARIAERGFHRNTIV